MTWAKLHNKSLDNKKRDIKRWKQLFIQLFDAKLIDLGIKKSVIRLFN